MKAHHGIAVLALALALQPGCSSESQDSSSSHWETCDAPTDCDDVAGAVSCSGGFCIDATGDKVKKGGASVDGAKACELGPVNTETPALGDLLGAGVGDDGTIYVADEVGGSKRLFVSANDALTPVNVTGSGETSTADGAVLTLDFEDEAGNTRSLRIVTAGSETSVALVDGPGKPDTEGVALMPIDEALLRGMTIVASPTLAIEYFAELTSGEHLVVVRPGENWTYEDFRVFYGAGTDLVQRAVTDVQRARDGGSTHILFDLDGQQADAFFPVTGAPVLTVDGGETGMTKITDKPPTGFSYFCL